MNDILPDHDPEANYIPDNEAPDYDLVAPPEPGDFLPNLVLPEAPVLKKLVLPECPTPLPIPRLMPRENETLAEAKARHAADRDIVLRQNASAEKAWKKACEETRHGVDVENRALLRAHNVACAEANAEYQRAKSEYDRYQSGKLRLEARIEQAKRDANAKAVRRAARDLAKLEKQRSEACKDAARATREKERARRAQEVRIAGIREQHQLRQEARQVQEDKRKAWIEKIAAENRALTQECGDPFQGLSADKRRERVLNAYYFKDHFFVEAKIGFLRVNASRFEELLEIHAGKSTTNPQGVRGLPPAKIARNSIETTRHVNAVGHFAWLPAGVLPTYISGESRTVLNLSTHRMGRIADSGKWGADGDFPILSEALENGFGLYTHGEQFGQLQLDTFLSVLARAAKCYEAGMPRISAAIILCGDPDAAKSWTAKQISMVFGGVHACPWKYFQSGCKGWNDDLAESSIWLFKDPIVQTAAQQATTTAAFKQALSDQSFRVETRYLTATEVERYQLLIGTMNRDAKSRSCMPTHEIADKVNVFRLYQTLPQSTFDHLKENPEYMLTEHAAFRRFLLEYEIPEHVKGGSRYGVKTFTHPEFRGGTLYTAEIADVGDLIVDLAERTTDVVWCGTATEFLRAWESKVGRRIVGWDNVKIGRGLTKVFEDHPNLVDKKQRNGTYVYHLFLDRYRDDADATGMPVEELGGGMENRGGPDAGIPDSAAGIPVEESGGGMVNWGSTDAGMPDSAAGIQSLLSRGIPGRGGASCG